MILAPEDAALFYRAWSALLFRVNEQRSIVPRLVRPTPDHPVAPELAFPIRTVLWAEDALRERFLAEAPSELGTAERDLVASWKTRVGDASSCSSIYSSTRSSPARTSTRSAGSTPRSRRCSPS